MEIYAVCPRCGNEMRVHNKEYWGKCHRDGCQLSGTNECLECLAKETECDNCGYVEEDDLCTCTCNELEAKRKITYRLAEAKELEAKEFEL